MADLTPPPFGIDIGQALRELPLETPAQSLWPTLAHHLPKKTKRHYLPAAMAAALALLTLVPMSLHSPTLTHSPGNADLQSVMQQSAQLENMVVATRNSTAGNASAEVISLALEDRIRAIDIELAVGTLNPTQQLYLWQQRVGLLQQAWGLYSTQRYQQAEGQPYEIALVESY